MHERRDNVLGTDVLGNFRLALECANLNFPTLETFEMALMRSFKLLLTNDNSKNYTYTNNGFPYLFFGHFIPSCRPSELESLNSPRRPSIATWLAIASNSTH